MSQTRDGSTSEIWNVWYRTGWLCSTEKATFWSFQVSTTDWTLLLCEQGIVGCPEGIWHSLAAGALAGTGMTVAASQFGAPEEHEPFELRDEGDPAWRRYPLEELASIVVKQSALFRHSIRLVRQDGTQDVYTVMNRFHLTAYAGRLQGYYLDQFQLVNTV